LKKLDVIEEELQSGAIVAVGKADQEVQWVSRQHLLDDLLWTALFTIELLHHVGGTN
jgi:hypothetical protein